MAFPYGLLRGFGLTILLFVVPGQTLSQGMATDTRLARFVCQAYSAVDQKFIGRVLVLEQTSTKSSSIGAAEPGHVDGTNLISEGNAGIVSGEAPFRLRIYTGVSLISNLSSLVDRSPDEVVVEQSDDVGEPDSTEDVRYSEEVSRRSLLMGRTDEEIVFELRNREASFTAEGHLMDYGGVGVRTGNRFSFRPTGRYLSAKQIDIFLKISRGVVDSGPGISSSPENGPYLCKEPALVSEGMAIGALCEKEYEGQVDLFTLAEPRMLVLRIQRTLEGHGFGPGPIDGILGPRTLSALWAWKESQGYEPVGFLTYEQLCEFLPEFDR